MYKISSYISELIYKKHIISASVKYIIQHHMVLCTALLSLEAIVVIVLALGLRPAPNLNAFTAFDIICGSLLPLIWFIA